MSISTALTILARREAAEHFMHADVEAFGAPSECHELVSRGETKRRRQARKHAEAEARMPYRVIRRRATKGNIPIGGPRWHRFVSRIYQNSYPY